MPIQVSSQDEWMLRAYPWRIDANGYAVFCKVVDGRTSLFYLHRMVAAAPDGKHVDHIDGDPGNNRRENLRLCSHAENMKNRKIPKNNKTGVKGVYQNKNGSYCAEIKNDGKKHRLGSFKWLSDAALAYRLAAIHLHGDFARFA